MQELVNVTDNLNKTLFEVYTQNPELNLGLITFSLVLISIGSSVISVSDSYFIWDESSI